MKTVAKYTRGLGRERLMDLFPNAAHFPISWPSYLFSLTLGAFDLPKTLRNFHGEVHRVRNVFHLTQVPFFHALVTKIQDGDKDIAVNSLELVIPCENSWMEHVFPPESFQRENRTTFSKFHLFPGIFQWNARKTCVPLTSQLELPEFLGKWKAPLVFVMFLLSKSLAQAVTYPPPSVPIFRSHFVHTSASSC